MSLQTTMSKIKVLQVSSPSKKLLINCLACSIPSPIILSDVSIQMIVSAPSDLGSVHSAANKTNYINQYI